VHSGDAVVGHWIAQFFPRHGWFGGQIQLCVPHDDRYEVRAQTAVAVIRLRVEQTPVEAAARIIDTDRESLIISLIIQS
jgi:hypothetical protein